MNERARADLFEPITLNRLKLPNRLIRSATWEGMCRQDGRPTEELTRLYRRLARSGIGLIVSGFAYVSAEGKPLPGALACFDSRHALELAALARAVHEEGGAIALQIGHAGGQTRSAICGVTPLAPSALAAPQYRPETPREINTEEIEVIVGAFARAARLAQSCGFDAIQLHAAHGYLINQFLSPLTNRRSDAYGGDLQGRSRFLVEICREVRRAVGPSYPVLAKLNGSDHLAGGLDLPEAIEVARMLEAEGIDAIEVSGGTPASADQGPVRTGIVSPDREAYNLSKAKAIKAAVRCPVIAVGGIRSYWTARGILRHGESDMIGLCRPLVREPNLARLWRLASESTLAKCTSCNSCFKSALKGGLSCVHTAKG